MNRRSPFVAFFCGLAALLPLLCFAVSCDLRPDAQQYLGQQAAAAFQAADRNADGQVTNRELRGTVNDPNFWFSMISGALGLFGVGAGGVALSRGGKLEREQDEQWDAHKQTAVELAQLRAAADVTPPADAS